jgi:VWFA-related protein
MSTNLRKGKVEQKQLRVWIAAYLCCVCISSITFAQQTTTPPIRINSQLVNIEALVTDKRTGARIEGLKKENFEVFDDGRKVEITHFRNASDTNKKLALFLIFDVRNLTIGKALAKIVSAMEAAIAPLQKDDELAIFAFDNILWRCNEQEELEWMEVQKLTSERSLVKDALASLATLQQKGTFKIDSPKPGQCVKVGFFGGTPNGHDIASMLKEIIAQSKELDSDVRPTVIVISDDINGGTISTINQTAEQLLASRLTVNGLRDVKGAMANFLTVASEATQGTALLMNNKSKNVRYYSAKTGGEVVNVKNDDYQSGLEQLIGNFVGRYSLGFEPDESKQDGKLHKLTIKVKVPPEKGEPRKIEVRARQGYIVKKEVVPVTK